MLINEITYATFMMMVLTMIMMMMIMTIIITKYLTQLM